MKRGGSIGVAEASEALLLPLFLARFPSSQTAPNDLIVALRCAFLSPVTDFAPKLADLVDTSVTMGSLGAVVQGEDSI